MRGRAELGTSALGEPARDGRASWNTITSLALEQRISRLPGSTDFVPLGAGRRCCYRAACTIVRRAGSAAAAASKAQQEQSALCSAAAVPVAWAGVFAFHFPTGKEHPMKGQGCISCRFSRGIGNPPRNTPPRQGPVADRWPVPCRGPAADLAVCRPVAGDSLPRLALRLRQPRRLSDDCRTGRPVF